MYTWESETQSGEGCRGRISRKALMLGNQMRLLWEQHVYWMRLFISGTVFDSPDVEVTQERLLRNPKDFAAVLERFYGAEDAEKFAELLTSHLTIAAGLVSAAKVGDSAKAADAERRWYENASQIAAYFSRINPYWSARQWREMLDSHLAMTKQEAADFISKNYEASVSIFERIEQEALDMADMMTGGILLQFPSLFM
ncbi:MAG: acetylglutamate kinase [Roseburia sp.]